MNLLINLSTLKKGGGQNVGLNFIQSLKSRNFTGVNTFFVVVQNSEIHKILKNYNENRIVFMPSNPVKRILKELFLGGSIVRKHKIDIIYSYFGYGIYPKKVLQISGSADSNLFFPEVNFWEHYSGIKLTGKKIIDHFRIWGLKRSTAVIFENKAMQVRGKELFGLKRSIFIMPSYSKIISNDTFKLSPNITSIPKGLFFCGWQKNKNYMIIPKVASLLKQKGIKFNFVITAPPDQSAEHIEFLKQIKFLDVEDYVSIVGMVKKSEITSLYNQIDLVFLLSALESFSNNIIEAWVYQKPLVIANEKWAQSICGNAAQYVDKENPQTIMESITFLLEDNNNYSTLVNKGTDILNTYPSVDQKTQQEIDYIKEIYEEYN